LPINGIYVICGETINQRRRRKYSQGSFLFNSIYVLIDFLYHRFFPKILILKDIYFFITKGKNRVLSKSEMIGRLVFAGFNILEVFNLNGLTYIISQKENLPNKNYKVSIGPFLKMKRVGFKGEIIEVYKLRTMHPYSEFCQDYIDKKNKLSKSGKFNNDFRITSWGPFLRKYWLDELPMLINLFYRQLNIVGVRPLSEGYFKKYPKELQIKRVKFKPGLIPPYYADLPKNFNEILESEIRYLNLKEKNPIKTDIFYFLKSLANIFLKGARSG
tara:strand:- start:280 stop:1098 length:819 start_codon:yes stop_codon:yes gene_type:complete